jgi:type IV secretory pathway VirB10-like protein
VLLGLLIAAGGAAGAIFYSRSQSPPKTIVATTPVHPTSTTTVPEQPTSTATTTSTTKPAPPPPPPKPQVISWPTGKSGYTVVLTSVPAGGGRAAAVAQANRALGAGLAQVGVLDSSQYSSLHPGYYVVFSGVYETTADAQTAASRAHTHGYSAAYTRRITP